MFVLLIHMEFGYLCWAKCSSTHRRQSTLLVLKKPVCCKLKHIDGMLPRKLLIRMCTYTYNFGK